METSQKAAQREAEGWPGTAAPFQPARVLPDGAEGRAISPWMPNSREAFDWMGLQRRVNRMRRGGRAAAALLETKFARFTRSQRWLITLTYRADAEHRRKHVSEYLDRLRKWARSKKGGRQQIGYVWVIELTEKGKPHYHVLVWTATRRAIPKGDQAGWWPHGMTQTARAKNGSETISYLVDYLSKGNSVHSIPRGARLFGCGGLTAADRRSKAYQLLPRYVRDAFDEGDGVIRAKGGGWVSRVTGEFLPGSRLVYYDHFIYCVKGDQR